MRLSNKHHNKTKTLAGLSSAHGLYLGGSVGTPRFVNSINGIGSGADSHEGTGYKLYLGQVSQGVHVGL